MADFVGFEIIEQAAFLMLGTQDEAGFIAWYRENLCQGMVAHGLELEQAAKLADRLVEIIDMRKREIELSAGSHTLEVMQ